VTRPRINTGNLKRLLVLVPFLKEQVEIVNKFDAVQFRLASEELKLEKLKKQKSGLMHDLLTGKVPVTVDTDTAELAHV